MIAPEISEVKDELLENIDFVFVPEECWTFLAEKYGTVDNATAIGRQVNINKVPSLFELKLLCLYNHVLGFVVRVYL